MIDRKHAEKFIAEQFKYLDAWYESDLDKLGIDLYRPTFPEKERHHYGKVELRELLDFVYEAIVDWAEVEKRQAERERVKKEAEAAKLARDLEWKAGEAERERVRREEEEAEQGLLATISTEIGDGRALQFRQALIKMAMDNEKQMKGD